ncbi:hypothetical protein U9M48_000137 [Paspalum notatum var. saurae]|uniref:Uncharacterized protein n=1 Tax=Paspalum notatum var. saurae TaxID=547442 RepID=A0AAQ3PJU5_PASNO
MTPSRAENAPACRSYYHFTNTRTTTRRHANLGPEKLSEDPDEDDYFDSTRGHHSDTSLLQIL